VDSGQPEFKNPGFTVHNFEFFEKIKKIRKYVKKIDEILRSLVNKTFQTSNVCMVKI
jgi:hypothetical protein